MPLHRVSPLLAVLLLLLCIPAGPSYAQQALLSPADFLGYELGSRFTRHHQVVDYVEHVAEHADHVRLERYGQTNEGRPLMVAFVSSPENMARLDQVRTDNLGRIGLPEGTSSGTDPAIVWLSYNVHGNESVSTEAAMATLYDLADPTNAQTQAWLANTVVILDPCLNPDGRDRYVNWYNRMVGTVPTPNPEAREHHEPWPGGRTNHYYFDLNRDWAWATQVETQQRLPLYNRWMPHIHVDFHEQGVDAPYYFAPAAEPYHERITPWQRTLQTMIGANHTRYFDREGWLYFTRQVFDLFYPGYGDTWPTFNGAVGMTYEQGGSGRAGLGILTAEGDTLTLRDRITHHHTTSLSTIETAANNYEQVVGAFADYFTSADRGTYRTFVVKGDNRDKVLALADLLDHQGIRYGFATGATQARGFGFGEGRTASVAVAPGDLVVHTDQPKGLLAGVLFEPDPVLADSLSYDITSWALPYVYGLDTFALSERLDIATQPRPAPQEPATTPTRRPYAYLAEWTSFEDVQFLAALLQHDIKLRYTTVPFELDGRRYSRGTLILTRPGNEALGDRYDQIIRETAARFDQSVVPVSTGYVTSGADFGSSDVVFLEKPEVAVLAGSPLSSYAVGEVWHFFDQQLGYPVTLIHPDDFGGIDLGDYDVLILPSGSYDEVLTDTRLDDLRAWIREGGRLVAMERGAAFLAGKDGFALQRREDPAEDDEAETPEDALRTYADRRRDAISDNVSGAIFRVQVDHTHPLAFGYGTRYFTLKRGSDAFAFLEDDWNVGVLREDARVSGFAGAQTAEKLENTLVFGVQNMGRGAIIYLLDDPLFRGFWYNGRLLFSNAVFLVGQ